MNHPSRQSLRILEHARPIMEFLTSSEWARRGGGPAGSTHPDPPRWDFVTGNPYEMPIPKLGEAIAAAAIPRNKDWFAYKMNVPEARAVVQRALRQRTQLDFEATDIHMTTGGFAALAAAMRAVADPGDEIIVSTPCFFFYPPLIAAAGANVVRVPARPSTFDLDIEGLRRAITTRTAAVLVNSPSNPSGRIYPPEQLEALAAMLEAESQRHGRRIYLLSDEAFREIVYDDVPHHSPTRFYPWSFLLYTYGKTLLSPGERIGYLAIPPTMPAAERAAFGEVIQMAQIAHGWCFPNATLQYALAELEPLCIDVGHLRDNRDRLYAGLTASGYEVVRPQGTFFMLVRSPWEDDVAFADLLTRSEVFVMPGSIPGAPGYLRLSLCVRTETITGALPGFAEARRHAERGGP
jgi:aspartate aminotransferase